MGNDGTESDEEEASKAETKNMEKNEELKKGKMSPKIQTKEKKNPKPLGYMTESSDAGRPDPSTDEGGDKLNEVAQLQAWFQQE
jgi:hypothetical protein